MKRGSQRPRATLRRTIHAAQEVLKGRVGPQVKQAEPVASPTSLNRLICAEVKHRTHSSHLGLETNSRNCPPKAGDIIAQKIIIESEPAGKKRWPSNTRGLSNAMSAVPSHPTNQPWVDWLDFVVSGA